MTPETNSPPCVCCWPHRFTPAVVMDKNGWPCCAACISKPDRELGLPWFALRHLVQGIDVTPDHPDMLEDAA